MSQIPVNRVTAEPMETGLPSAAIAENDESVTDTPSLTNSNQQEKPTVPEGMEESVITRNRALIDAYTQFLDDGGLYPDVEDPQFVSRLLRKTEFADTVSTQDPNENPCQSGPDFEITPVQRFVATFLHPRTPQMSALLYHGVGVGKTCAAIQAAEAYLDMYPRRKVFIVCPRAIRPGFYRTIFDMSRLMIGKGDTPNSAIGCTGNTYLKLSSTLQERDPKLIAFRIKKAIDRRYSFFGQLEFRNQIRNVKKNIPRGGEREQEQIALALQKEFNQRMLIIDEAHNLRDVIGTTVDEEQEDTDTVTMDKDEAKGGKELTPFLKEVVSSTEGMKLLLMTATPMFNSVFEIHFLLNLMRMNDKKPEIKMEKLLNRDGTPAPGAEEVLREVANAQVSFMRGENPNSFPIRLFPEGLDPNGSPVARLTEENYPAIELSKDMNTLVSDSDREKMSHLPIVLSSAPEESEQTQILKSLTISRVKSGGRGYQVIDSLLQAGNCIFPNEAGTFDISTPAQQVGVAGFDGAFIKGMKGSVTAKDVDWLLLDNFQLYSPKGGTILRQLKNSEGVQFVQSRFVTTGAYLLALALEANGQTPQGRSSGFLTNGIGDGLGKQCARCPLREKEHADTDHSFVPAKYVLLTGDPILSPNNAEAVAAARSDGNINGEIVKVVLGSQIAGEGLDLRFIREVHILDAWFHLNKTEQIIGRGIRFCSHSLLDSLKRNCTVFLHAAAFPDLDDIETADLYCYRQALKKAVQVGVISRLLKVQAVDCNLRKNVTILKDLGNRKQMDSQGQPRNGPQGEVQAEGPGILLDDMDFTAICDWTECKPIVCQPDVDVSLAVSDDSTFDTFAARQREAAIQKVIKSIFAQQPYLRQEDLIDVLLQRGIPRPGIELTLQGLVNNRLFRVRSGAQDGQIIQKNKQFLFQPDAQRDQKIPMALRIASFPIKRDEFDPSPMIAEKPVITMPIAAEGEVAIANNSSEGITLWGELKEWASKVARGDLKVIGDTMKRRIELLTPDVKMRGVLNDKLSMILLVAQQLPEKAVFGKALQEQFWDEWISPKVQVKILVDSDEGGIAEEQVIQSGAIRIVRQINAENGILDFFCEKGTACPRGIVSAIQELPTEEDPIKGSDANQSTTGAIYGFMVPKRGILVFKTNEPHGAGDKPKGGQECAIVTTKSHYIDKLIVIGKELEKAGLPDLNLKPNILKTSLDLVNTTRGCTMLDIILRYCDAIRVGGKKWFQRPIASYYSLHRGLVSAAAKSAALAAQKEQKRQEVEAKAKAKEEAKAAKVTAAKPKKAAPKTDEVSAKPKFTLRPVTAAPTGQKKRIVIKRPVAPLESLVAPVAAPIAEPVVEAAAEPVTEPVVEAAAEPVAEPAADNLPEFDEFENINEPVAEPEAKPEEKAVNADDFDDFDSLTEENIAALEAAEAEEKAKAEARAKAEAEAEAQAKVVAEAAAKAKLPTAKSVISTARTLKKPVRFTVKQTEDFD